MENNSIELLPGDLIRIDGAMLALVEEVTTAAKLKAQLPISDELIERIRATPAEAVAVVLLITDCGPVAALLIRTAGKWLTPDGHPLRISVL
jgi:hypothetical protein